MITIVAVREDGYFFLSGGCLPPSNSHRVFFMVVGCRQKICWYCHSSINTAQTSILFAILVDCWLLCILKQGNGSRVIKTRFTMNKQTFENVKAILTTHHVYANGTYYSLSLIEHIYDDFEYCRITVYSNNEHGSFHDGFASFFCQVADITCCAYSFRSENNVCVCVFF